MPCLRWCAGNAGDVRLSVMTSYICHVGNYGARNDCGIARRTISQRAVVVLHHPLRGQRKRDSFLFCFSSLAAPSVASIDDDSRHLTVIPTCLSQRRTHTARGLTPRDFRGPPLELGTVYGSFPVASAASSVAAIAIVCLSDDSHSRCAFANDALLLASRSCCTWPGSRILKEKWTRG